MFRGIIQGFLARGRGGGGGGMFRGIIQGFLSYCDR